MQNTYVMRLAGAVAMSAVAGGAAQANTFVAPLDLAPGAAYRLIFMTVEYTSATSTDIATYDEFVTLSAGANPLLPTTAWRALVSTPSVNAVDHLACVGDCAMAPIYNLLGHRVADSLSALFSTGITSCYFCGDTSALLTQANGTDNGAGIWSGSTNAGIGIPGEEMGGSSGYTRWGWANYYAPGYWLDAGYPSDSTGGLSLVGVSGDFVMAEAVPEPVSGAVLAAGVSVLAAARRRRAARG